MVVAVYLMISAESIKELLVKLKTWKSETDKKGLGVNDYCNWHNMDLVKKSGKDACLLDDCSR